MLAPVEINGSVRQFIADNFLFGDAVTLSDSDSLLEGRLIDSMGVLDLVAFLEKQFGIRVGDDEVLPQNLDSLGGIAAFVRQKLERGHDPVVVAYAS